MTAKIILKMGIKGLTAHPFRAFVVWLLAAIALGLLGASVTAAVFNEEEARKESLYAYEECYTVASENGFTQAEYLALTEQITAPFAKFTQASGTSVLDDLSYFFSPEGEGGEQTDNMMTQSPLDIACADSAFLPQQGTALTGRLPERKDEIAIPVCLYNTFAAYGYYDHISSPVHIEITDQGYDYVYDPAYVRKVTSEESFADGTYSLLVALPNGETMAAKIVGIVDYGACAYNHRLYPEEKAADGYDTLYVSEEFFTAYAAVKNAEVVSDYIVVTKGASYNADASFLSFVENSGEYAFVSGILNAIEINAEVLSSIKNIFLYVGIGLMAFCCGLIYQFISFSLESRKGEIGILRALGAGKKVIYEIFFTECLLFALLQAAAGVVLSCLFIPVINAKFVALGVKVVFMRFTYLSLLVVFGVSVAASLLSSFIPIRKTANRSPVEAIRMNEI